MSSEKNINITQEEFNKKEKEVLSHLNKIWSDINNSIEILRKNDRSLVKSEVCLAFIGADAFARFYEIIRDEENNNEKRFRIWLDTFVFTERNEEYRKYKNKIKCDSATAWELRNSLLHFYGLPKRGGACFGQLPEDEQKKLRKYIKTTKSQQSLRIIDPYYLIKAILRGLLLQLLFFEKLIKNNPKKYIDGILRCYQITRYECSVFVDLNKK